MEETKIERPAFLMDLLAEVDRCEGELFPPDSEVEKGERVISEVTGYARRLFCLARFYHREEKMLAVQLEFDSGNNAEGRARHEEMKHKRHLLNDMWWCCVNAQFNTWADSIGIRKNWQLVELSEKNKSQQMPEFLRRLLESGGQEE